MTDVWPFRRRARAADSAVMVTAPSGTVTYVDAEAAARASHPAVQGYYAVPAPPTDDDLTLGETPPRLTATQRAAIAQHDARIAAEREALRGHQ